jgi:hypothetical protein
MKTTTFAFLVSQVALGDRANKQLDNFMLSDDWTDLLTFMSELKDSDNQKGFEQCRTWIKNHVNSTSGKYYRNCSLVINRQGNFEWQHVTDSKLKATNQKADGKKLLILIDKMLAKNPVPALSTKRRVIQTLATRSPIQVELWFNTIQRLYNECRQSLATMPAPDVMTVDQVEDELIELARLDASPVVEPVVPSVVVAENAVVVTDVAIIGNSEDGQRSIDEADEADEVDDDVTDDEDEDEDEDDVSDDEQPQAKIVQLHDSGRIDENTAVSRALDDHAREVVDLILSMDGYDKIKIGPRELLHIAALLKLHANDELKARATLAVAK